MIVSAPRVVLLLCVTLLVVSMVFLCVGLTGDKWLYQSEDNYFGLYKVCDANLPKCRERENILKFEDESKINISIKDQDLDIIMMLLIAAIVATFIATISSFSMCCFDGKTAWKCAAAFTGILASFGGLLGAASLGYFEKVASDLSEGYDHKWSSILTWVGVLFLLIAAVLAFIMIRVRPKPDLSNQGHMVYTHNITSYPSKEYHMASKPAYVTRDNRGYEMEVDSRGNVSRDAPHSNRQYEAVNLSKNYWMENTEDGYHHKAYKNNREEARNHPRDSRVYQDAGRRPIDQRKDDHRNRDYNSRDYNSNRNDRRQDYRSDRNSNSSYHPSSSDYRSRDPSSSDYRPRDTQPYEIRSSRRTRQPSYDNEGYEMR